jgi:hypothetical protein
MIFTSQTSCTTRPVGNVPHKICTNIHSRKAVSPPATVYNNIALKAVQELWRMASSVMLHRVALLRTDVSEEVSAFFIKATRRSELRTTLAVTSNQRTLRASVASWS